MEKSIASLIKCRNILERDRKYINKMLKGNYQIYIENISNKILLIFFAKLQANKNKNTCVNYAVP